MTCYNPYKWNMEINGNKWKFGFIEVDGKKEEVWILEGSAYSIIVKNDDNAKTSLKLFSFPQSTFTKIEVDDKSTTFQKLNRNLYI